MGARYARAANGVMPTKLPLVPRRVLVAMALRALDSKRGDAERGLYYGGRYRLLGDLGIMPTRTTLRHLTGDLTKLVELGLIERVGKPAPGQRAVYKLLISVDNLPP
jgi:hypothetical protein